MSFGDGMRIIIRGFAERIASMVNDWVHGVKSAGASDAVVSDRLRQEVEGGQILSEMKRFATAYAPGYVGEMVSVFGRDTLQDRALARAALREVRHGRPPAKTVSEAVQRITEDINDPFRRPPDTSGVTPEGEILDIPPETPMEARFWWVAIHDRGTCEVCEFNSHEGAKSFDEWLSIGVPRSGACAGQWRCRCVLVPEDNLREGDIPESIQIPTGKSQ